MQVDALVGQGDPALTNPDLVPTPVEQPRWTWWSYAALGTWNDDRHRRKETMALVRSITITTTIAEQGKEAGAVTGHTVEACVEVGGEERVYDVSGVNPTLTALVEQLVRAVHQETLQESRPAMQRVVDAEKAFER
jgi:hypothetical protein